MQNPKIASTILSEPYAVDLILFLDREGKIMATQLKVVHSNYMKLLLLARRLNDKGILHIEEKRGPRLTYFISLTPKGKKVAEKLKAAREIVED
jgi:DNA-binding MarR family transcriptional regulator